MGFTPYCIPQVDRWNNRIFDAYTRRWTWMLEAEVLSDRRNGRRWRRMPIVAA